MLCTNRSATRIVAICLGLAVMQAYVVASPTLPPHNEGTAQAQTSGQMTGQLIIRGRTNITVNGQIASDGATIYTDSRIQTPDDVGATIVLNDLGAVEIGPNSDLVLDFSSGRLSLKILKGCVRSRVKEGVNYSETPQPGEPVERRKDKKTICVGAIAIAGGSQTAGSIGAGTGGRLFGLSIPAAVAALGAIIGAILGPQNNETAPVISPIR